MSEHSKGRTAQPVPKDEASAEASGPSQSAGPSSPGGGSGFYDLLKNFTLPPIIAVCAAPVLVAWWCWTYELPYMDIMSDLAANALSFVVVVSGFALLVCAVFLGPGLYRLLDDYMMFHVAKMPRCHEGEEIRNLRWSTSFASANLVFFSVEMILFFKIAFGSQDAPPDNHIPIWIQALLWAAGMVFYSWMIWIHLKSDFRGVGALCRSRASRDTFWSACGYFRRYIAGDVDLPGGNRPGEHTQSAVVGPRLASVDGETDKASGTSVVVRRPVGLSGVVMMAILDGFYLLLILGIAGYLNNTFDQTGASGTRIFVDIFMYLLFPVLPALILAPASVWAMVRSRQAITVAALIAVGVVAFYFPGGPALINKLAFSLGFGGDRPAQLALLPEAACSHPELFSHTLDCSLTKPYQTDTVLLEWMGPGKTIVRATGAHRDANPIVFDRKVVSSYEIISARK